MSNIILPKRVIAVASSEGIEKAEKALLKQGFDSKTDFAASSLVALNAVTTFFNGDPIQLNTFKRICDRLQLAWREIIELHTITTTSSDGEIEQLEPLEEISPGIQPSKGLPAIARAATVSQRDEAEAIIRTYEQSNLGDKWNDIQEILQDPLRRHALQTIDFSDADLKGVNFKGADLSGADLSGADLSGATLIGANLCGANLSGANLSHVYLSDANLSRANLHSANLYSAKLLTANLSEAVLNRAVLVGAVLTGAHLNSATLSGAILSGATLSGATFSGAILSGAILSKANLNWATLDDADLSRTDLSDVDLSRASLQNTRLGQGWGLSNEEQRALAERGAIFSDSEE